MANVARALLLLLLSACATVPAQLDAVEARFSALTLGPQVAQSTVDAAATELASCTGQALRLDGWTVYMIAAEDIVQSCSGIPSFKCYGENEQGCNYPVPPGKTPEQCPCVCTGITSPNSRRIALAHPRGAQTRADPRWLQLDQPRWTCGQVGVSVGRGTTMADAEYNGIPTINPLGLDAYSRTKLYRMWASTGGYAKAIEMYIWQDSFDSAFEEMVEYLDDAAPGVFETIGIEQLKEAAADLNMAWDPEWPDWDDRKFNKVVEHAEADMTSIGHTTLKSGTHIPHENWGGVEVTDKTELREVWYASANAYEKEYGETLKPPRGLGEMPAALLRRPKWMLPKG